MDKKQIHQENEQTILYYSLACLISALLVVATSMMKGLQAEGNG